MTGFTRKRRADHHFINAGGIDLVADVLINQRASGSDQLIRFRIVDVLRSHSAEDTVAQSLHHIAGFDESAHLHAILRAAVLLRNDEVLRHIHQSAGEVAGVSRLQSRIGQTLTGTVGRHEVLQNVQAFTEVSRNRRFNNGAVRLRHQASHTGQLTDLGRRASGTGVSSHVHGVERFLGGLVAMAVDNRLDRQILHHDLTDFISGTAPDVHHLVIAFALRHETGGVLGLDLFHFLLSVINELLLLGRNLHIVNADRNTGLRGEVVAAVLQSVNKVHRRAETADTEAGRNQTGDFLLLQRLVDVGELHALRQDFGQQSAARSRFDTDRAFVRLTGFAVQVVLLHADRAAGLQRHDAGGESAADFIHVLEEHAFARRVDAGAGAPVETQHHILRRNVRRITVSREEDVVRRQHQRTGFGLSFQRERHVNSHLVAVEVGVERSADERRELESLAADQTGFERLNAETVQRRRTVQHHGVLVNHLFENVPDHRILGLDHLLRSLDRVRETTHLKLVVDEGLEELESHRLRHTALVHLQFRTHRNHGTAGVVHTLTEQVLTEAAGLTLDHVSERLERALVRTGHRLAAAAVVDQRVDSFLQHALFVAHDDVRGLQLEQTLQTVVTVDHAAVQIVQIGGRKTAAVERYERTQIRRQHRQHLENHPFRMNSGTMEAFEDLQALRVLLDLRVGIGFLQLRAQRLDFLRNIDRLQQLTDCLGTHHGLEFVTELFGLRGVIVFGEELAALQRGHARINNDIGFEVQHAFDIAQRDIEHHAHAGRQALQEPDVSHRARELDVAHAFAAHLGQRHFDAALLADDAAMLHALVLTAKALVVLDRPENTAAEKTITLRLKGAVIDRFRLLHFAVRPLTDLFRRSDRNAQGIKVIVLLHLLKQIEKGVIHLENRP